MRVGLDVWMCCECSWLAYVVLLHAVLVKGETQFNQQGNYELESAWEMTIH